MIKIICGMSGSGKTSFVLKNIRDDEVILDLDFLQECLNIRSTKLLKEIQLLLCEYFINLGKPVYYVTCYPNEDEEIFFQNKSSEYIWINTDITMCNQNVIKRQRKKDLVFKDIFEFNKRIMKKYISSNIKFQVSDVFNSNERW